MEDDGEPQPAEVQSAPPGQARSQLGPRRRSRRPQLTADRAIPLGTALALFAAYLGLALLRTRTFDASYDLGYFRQAAWLISHNHSAFISIRGLYLLADHASFVFWPMAYATRVFGPVGGLLGVQSALLALGVLPLWSFARRVAGLPLVPASAVLVAYGLYPALQNVSLADFHPEVAAVPALIGAAVFGHERRWRPYAACVAVALLSREDMALAVATLGLMFAIFRPWRRLGLATVVTAVVVFALDAAVIQPHFSGGQLVQGAIRFPAYGPSLSRVLVFALTHPFRIIHDLGSHPNTDVWIALFGPVLFLPLLSPRWLVPGIPLQAMYLLTNIGAAHTITFQYTIAVDAFVFVALAVALGKLLVGEGALRGRTAQVLPVPLLVASVFFFASDSVASPYNRPWRWWNRDDTDQARIAAARLVPKHAAVATTADMLWLFGDRAELYGFPNPFGFMERQPGDPLPLAVRQRHVQWLVLDTAAAFQWGDVQVEELSHVSDFGFRQVFSRDGILVYNR